MSGQLTTTLRPYQIGMAGDQPLHLYSTMDPTRDDDRIRVASALLSHVSILDAVGPQPIVQVCVWESEEESQKTPGEMVVLRRTGFIARDGTCWCTTSGEMADKIGMLIGLFGPPPWQRPVWMVFGASKSKSGNTYHWFRPVAAPPGQQEREPGQEG